MICVTLRKSEPLKYETSLITNYLLHYPSSLTQFMILCLLEPQSFQRIINAC